MQKLILLSILAMTIAVPAAAAREPRPRLGLRRTVAWMFAGILAYAFAVLFLYPRTL